jgi:signal transduction histidine kinase
MSKAPPKRMRDGTSDIKRIEDSLEKKNIAFEALFGLFEKIGTTLDLDTIVRLFLITLMGQLRLRRIALYLSSSATGRFEMHHALGTGRQALPGDFRVCSVLSQWLRAMDASGHIDDFFSGTREGTSEESIDFLGALAERGFAFAVPLIDRDELIGVVFISGKVTGRGFSHFDNELLRMLAKIAVITIKNAALYRAAVRAKQEIERFSKIKKEFINHTSHELRTPITVLKSALWSIEPEKADEGILIDMSKDAVLRMQGKVEQLLSLNDIELNATALELVRIDISSVLEDCLREIIPELEEKQVTVDYDDRSGGREIAADPAKMKLVFRSIIENAVNYVERGGTISIDTGFTDVPPGAADGIELPDWTLAADEESSPGAGGVIPGAVPPGAGCDDFEPAAGSSYLVVRIGDDGIGIPPDEIACISEPFRRASNSPLKNVKGLGIGLSVARRIVAEHGGMLFCRSVEGEGTEFSVWLSAE